jgi:putative endonuclease
MKAHYFYVYILTSISDPRHHYTGFTEDLPERLKHHNTGSCPHTAKFKPWQIETAVAFTSRKKALAFEAYLKSGSGREFSRRHL